eukprot:NODE_1425_length_1144_cov_548.953168.p1 GENE.NODE_1425_length_1144_cov_548.953168~~NODE_1425_length_1144_cov_548.953168.p1  ORF type:complete len:195 (-),score=41.13 NODE_1425_length_1144_cov_548.953168:423-1007(-)
MERESGSCPYCEHTLKVGLAGDVRRLHAAWPADASAAEVLAAIHRVAREGFGYTDEAAPPLALRYTPTSGSARALTEVAIADFLSVARGGVLKLSIEAETPLQYHLPHLPHFGGSLAAVAALNCPTPQQPETREAALPLALRHSDAAACADMAEGFTIATPPGSPRCSISEEYEFAWSIVEATSPRADEDATDP